jgi:cell division protein FtsA
MGRPAARTMVTARECVVFDASVRRSKEARRLSSQGADHVCVVDLGSGSIRVGIFAALDADSEPEIIGIGRATSEGIHCGGVVDLAAASESLSLALNMAQHMAGVRVRRVILCVGGNALTGTRAEGVTGVEGQVVTGANCEQAVRAAAATFGLPQQTRIHQVVNDYTLDGRSHARKPLALGGQCLQANLFMLSVSTTGLRNLVRVVERTGVAVESVCSSLFAAGQSALTEGERRTGAALVDIGAGTLELSIYQDGALRRAETHALGGDRLTRDLSRNLLIPRNDAERVKRMHGRARPNPGSDEPTVDVATIGLRPMRQVTPSAIAGAMGGGLKELLSVIGARVTESGLAAELDGGLVFCGSCAGLPGLAGLAEEVLSTPVRLAYSTGIGGLSEMLDQLGDCAIAGAAQLWHAGALEPWGEGVFKPGRRAPGARHWFDYMRLSQGA